MSGFGDRCFYAWGTVELKTEFGALALGLRAQGSEVPPLAKVAVVAY